MKKSTLFKILVTLIIIMAGAAAKAQITTLAGLPGAAAVYCPSEAVKLTAASTGSTTFTWKRYPGKDLTGTPVTLAGTAALLSDIPVTPGYYTYVSTGANANCESDVSDPVTVYILPALVANITGPSTTCVSTVGSTVLTSVVTNPTPVSETFGYTYTWSKDGTPIAGATGTTYTLSAADDAAIGLHKFTVTAKYAIKSTCIVATSLDYNVTVQANPAKPTVTITP